jgi:hypothetical protein
VDSERIYTGYAEFRANDTRSRIIPAVRLSVLAVHSCLSYRALVVVAAGSGDDKALINTSLGKKLTRGDFRVEEPHLSH